MNDKVIEKKLAEIEARLDKVYEQFMEAIMTRLEWVAKEEKEMFGDAEGLGEYFNF